MHTVTPLVTAGAEVCVVVEDREVRPTRRRLAQLRVDGGSKRRVNVLPHRQPVDGSAAVQPIHDRGHRLVDEVVDAVRKLVLGVVRSEFDDDRLRLQLRADGLDSSGPIQVGALCDGAGSDGVKGVDRREIAEVSALPILNDVRC